MNETLSREPPVGRWQGSGRNVTAHSGPQGDLDSAFAALTDKQQRFLVEWLNTGNAYRSAVTAGYSPATARQQGHMLAHHAGILAAASELGRRELTVEAVRAQRRVATMAETATKESVKLASNIALMDRGGLHARSEQTITVTKEQSPKLVLKEILSLAARLGVDAGVLLGNAGYTPDKVTALLEGPDIQDAEWEPVAEPAAEPDPFPDVYGHDVDEDPTAGVNLGPVS